MKKGLIKGLTCLGLAGVMIGGVVGFAGCSNEVDVTDSSELIQCIIKKDIYLVHYENDTATLHKGDLTVYARYSGYSSAGLTPVLRFNCGKEIPTYLYNPYDTKPDASKYTDICDECFEIFN